MNYMIHNSTCIQAASAASHATATSQSVQTKSSSEAITPLESPTLDSCESDTLPAYLDDDVGWTHDCLNQPNHDDEKPNGSLALDVVDSALRNADQKCRNQFLFEKLQFAEKVAMNCNDDAVQAGDVSSLGDFEEKYDDDDNFEVGLLVYRTDAALNVASDFTTSHDNFTCSRRNCYPQWNSYRKELLLDSIDDLHQAPTLARCHDAVDEDDLSQGDIEPDYWNWGLGIFIYMRLASCKNYISDNNICRCWKCIHNNIVYLDEK